MLNEWSYPGTPGLFKWKDHISLTYFFDYGTYVKYVIQGWWHSAYFLLNKISNSVLEECPSEQDLSVL